MALLFFVIGVAFVIGGLRVRFGQNKTWWLNKSTAVTPTAIAFGLFPASVIFFVFAYIAFFQPSSHIRESILFYIGIPAFILTLVFSTMQPNFLKPKWLRWLEDNYGDFLPLLRDKARQSEWSQWKRQVRTQEGLENWVAEVLEKNSANSAQ